ncbi:MAG: FGGY-family carbohydrate kinase [Erysipelotrichaceae bacterium]|jgi:sugar (pentulose or hexulose) kinase|nr:FGGY-family carbohydrate kinase [Erysipelotrichaceae bacterium]
MNEKYILTLDFGTQSVRVSIVDTKGEIVALEKRKYTEPYFSKKPGWAEQNPNLYYDYMCDASKALFSTHPEYKEKIIGCALTCFRDSPVMCDENMKPLRDAILWLDQRLAKNKKPLPLLDRTLFHLVGMWNTIKLNRARTPANWVSENEPEIWANVKKYMNISTYITYKMTGEYKDSIANYTGHFPTDFKNRRFYKNDNHLKGKIFGIPLNKLCTIVPIGQIIGQINKETSEKSLIPEGTKMFAIGSDKSCETLGLGCITPDIAAVSCGTASTVEVTNKKYHEPEPFLPAYPSAIPGYYNMEVQVYRGYWMLGWFATQFAQKEERQAQETNRSIESILNDKLDSVSPGSNGLVLQPYWGPGLSRPLSRGSVIGFSDTHTKIHLYRAIIEGINYDLRQGLEGIEKSQHKKVKSIMISGGGSQSDAICQIAADIFNMPTSKVQTIETTTLGAAIAGFLAAKVFNNVEEAVKSMVHISKTYIPIKNNATHYNYLYKHAYKKMYPALKNVYKDIKKIEEDN